MGIGGREGGGCFRQCCNSRQTATSELPKPGLQPGILDASGSSSLLAHCPLGQLRSTQLPLCTTHPCMSA